MYPPRQNPSDLTVSEIRPTGTDLDREGFRPVALPALAAAVHVAATSARVAARKIAERRAASRFQHEDAPLI